LELYCSIKVLAPLKEATLLASKDGESLMVTNVIPIYHFCTDMLEESLKNFNKSDDSYIGIESAIEKLNHYYDKLSPMVGIALLLDPCLKKEMLTESHYNGNRNLLSLEQNFLNPQFSLFYKKVAVAAASRELCY
jgi:hypothetical protein